MSELYQQYRGIRGWVAAEVITDTEEEFECGTPFPIAGLAEVSKNTESSSEGYYYDNKLAGSTDTTGADEVTFSSAAIPDEAYAKITGQFYDAEKGMLVEGAREPKYFATGYITKKTDGTEMFVWRLKGKFSIPSSTHATEDDGAEGNGQEVTYTGIDTTHKFTVDGKKKSERAVTINTKINAISEETFFGTVQTPDTITKSV
jgi:phi13 family phage major tail protein